ncbi:hypothetical protein SMX71_002812 [Cronobacter dublinensis]|nr:hypothetical protein [Cronobacter dublinensis]
MKRIACVAGLNPTFSAHAHTFLRAVVLARHCQLMKGAQIRLFDDGGSREGALRAVGEITAWGAEAVVGHYVSSAAEAAAPEYAKRGVPLFLPAATASYLTRNATTWRLCDNDADYVAWVKSQIIQAQWQVATPEHDGSLRGISVSEQLAGVGAYYHTLWCDAGILRPLRRVGTLCYSLGAQRLARAAYSNGRCRLACAGTRFTGAWCRS